MKGICHRCEHRAQFIEEGHGPRAECGWLDKSKHGCYCYQPVKPVVMARDPGDDRPAFGPWMIAVRMNFVRLADEMKLHLKEVKDGVVSYWAIVR